MARDTVSTVIERVRRQLNSTVRMEVNVLAANLDSSETTVTLEHPLSMSTRNGGVLSVGNELMRIVDSNALAQEVIVIRGWQDSEPSAHVTGREVLVNPRWTLFDIYDAMYQEIDSWAPDIFEVANVTMPTTDDSAAVELDATYQDAIGVIKARSNWTERNAGMVWPDVPFSLMRGGDSWAAGPTTGLLVRFTTSTGYARVGNVLLSIAMPYTTDGITADTVLSTDKNIGASLLELIELGIKYRLLLDEESGKSARNAQDEPRRNEDVPPGAAMSLGQVLAQRYERRRSQEVIKFRTRYPMSMW